MTRLCRILLFGLFVVSARPGQSAAATRIAVSNFTTSDGSYRSMVAAQNFTTLAQAQIGDVSGMGGTPAMEAGRRRVAFDRVWPCRYSRNIAHRTMAQG